MLWVFAHGSQYVGHNGNDPLQFIFLAAAAGWAYLKWGRLMPLGTFNCACFCLQISFIIASSTSRVQRKKPKILDAVGECKCSGCRRVFFGGGRPWPLLCGRVSERVKFFPCSDCSGNEESFRVSIQAKLCKRQSQLTVKKLSSEIAENIAFPGKKLFTFFLFFL